MSADLARVAKISEGLRRQAKIVEAWEMKSPSHNNAYWVVAKVELPDGKWSMAAWILGGNAGIYAADSFADEISDWGSSVPAESRERCLNEDGCNKLWSWLDARWSK